MCTSFEGVISEVVNCFMGDGFGNGKQEQIAALGAIKLVVKSLARDVGEGRQAVALLRELSKDPAICEKIGKVQGCILLLVTMLNAENPHAVADARELLFDLAHNDQNVVQMGEANYFGPLTQRLNAGEFLVMDFHTCFLPLVQFCFDILLFSSQPSAALFLSSNMFTCTL